MRQRPARDRGQATVELALLLPVVVVLLLAVLQLGLVARDVVLVAHAAREAARAAAVDDDPTAPRRAAEAAGGLSRDRLTVEVSGRGEPGSRIRVEVRYRIRTSVPVLGALIADHEVTSTATMRVEGVGRSFPRVSDELGHRESRLPATPLGMAGSPLHCGEVSCRRCHGGERHRDKAEAAQDHPHNHGASPLEDRPTC